MKWPEGRDSSARKISQTLLGPVFKQIKLRPQKNSLAKEIQKDLKISSVTARVLAARGFEADKRLKNFLDPTLKDGLPDPSEMFRLDEACALVKQVLTRKGKIAICCDFDVDGLSGGSQLCHFLRALGAEVRVFVPDRFQDGYGLNQKMVQEAADDNCALLITVDFGTTATHELEKAAQLGLKTIVIDHHHVGDHRPPCDVFVNPQQEECGFADGVLCAAGLAWYFLAALRAALKDSIPAAAALDPRTYLDLACLGTICDMVPLVGPNRVIAKRGLELLSSTNRAGLIALKNVIGCKREVSCYDVSFGIGPRLNAAGRMVHGEVVVDLLTTSDRSAADRLASTLNKLNVERQDTEAEVKDRAVALLNERYGASGLPSALVVWDEAFHTGVIGIVAQRLVEMFYRPAAVLGLDEKGIYKGSVRGIKGLSVVETLEATGKHLIKFGGHEGAGGFSIEEKNIPAFNKAFIEESERRMQKISAVPYAEADTEVTLGDLSVELVDELRRLAPFGMGNPNPQLLLKGLKVVDLREIKSAHLKATLTDGSRYLAGLLWRQTSHPALTKGAVVDIVFRADYSNFNGSTELQANLQAIEPNS